MAIELKAAEAVEFAERIEHDAANLYRCAADMTTDVAVRDVLVKMAQAEVRHGEILADIRSGLKANPAAKPLDERSLEVLPVLADIIVTGAWQDISSRLRSDAVDGTVLCNAVGFEKDCIIFYSQLRDAVHRSEDRDRIDWIIRDELGHVAVLAGDLTRRMC